MVNRTNILYSVLISLIFCAVNISAATVVPDKLECIIQNKKMGLRDRLSHKMVIPCKYDLIECAGSDLYKVKINGLWGLVNSTGKVLLSPKYNELGGFSSTCKLSSAKTADKWGFIDLTGKFVIPEKYEAVVGFGKENHCSVKLNGKWGLIDNHGKVLIDFKYDESLYFQNGYSKCKKNGLVGILSLNGSESVPCQYKDSWFIKNGLLAVESNGKWGFIDVSGKVVIPFKYNHTNEDFEQDHICLDDEENTYIISKTSEILATFKDKNLYRIRTGEDGVYDLYLIRNKTAPYKKGVVNKKGEIIFPIDYQDVGHCFNQGLIKVKKSDKWGFGDINGKLVIDYMYDEVALCHEGKGIAVKKSDKWGMISPSGSTIIPFEYDVIDQNYVFARTSKNGKWGAIDNDARIVLSNKYDDISYPDRRLGFFSVKLNGKSGYADFYGNDTF